MHKRTREEWQALLAEHAASGLSARQFCVQHRLCPKYFSLRRRHLSDRTPSTFVRLQKTASVATPDTAAMALLRHGRSEVELRAVSPEWLSRLLAALA